MNRLPQRLRQLITLAAALAASTALLAAPPPPAPAVLLVSGTVSTPNAAERQYAQTIAKNLSRHLDAIGIPHQPINDEALTPELAGKAAVIILAYNPNPPESELAALRAAIARKAKLIVFYSASAPLAELMGLKLGAYATASLTDRWDSIVFDRTALPHAPEIVRQDSRSIRPAHPVAPDARIIARWTRSNTSQASEPAWLQSAQGYWMTHILLDDGDSNAKRRMLLALLGTCNPALWRIAASHSLTNTPSIANGASWEDAIDNLKTTARTAAVPLAIERLTAATPLPKMMRKSFDDNRYPEAIETAAQLRSLLVEAYALTQPSRPDNLRGIWLRQGTGLYPGNWDKTCRILKEAGITDIFPNFLSAGAAHYPSDVLGQSEVVDLYGDQLASCLDAAKRHGLRVHVWMICWSVQGATPERIAELTRAGRLQVSDTGKPLPWLCPSNPDNLRFEKDIVRELIRKYTFDGLQLDYIRYPDSHACFCGGCRQRFEAALGKPVAKWPDDMRQGPLRAIYNQWRVAQITRLVQDLATVMQVGAPKAKLSAAVFGRANSGLNSVAQDWRTWVQKGFVQFVCPMNYTEDLDRFNTYLSEQKSFGLPSDRIIPGIGVTANESRLDIFQVIDQIQAIRRQDFGGFMLFELNHTTERDILPMLRRGVLSVN